MTRHDKPITAERIERSLNRLAEIMVNTPAGATCLPIYERLEQELEAIRTADDKMAAVRERLRLSKDRTAARPAP